MPEVVEAFEGQATGERPVPDDGHDAPAGTELVLLGHRQAVGVADHRGRVAVLDPIVLRLGARRVPGEATGLAQGGEVGHSAGQHLVHVGLMAGVPQEDVARGVEHAVQGHGELDGAEVGPEVPVPGALDGVDDETTDLTGELLELGV